MVPVLLSVRWFGAQSAKVVVLVEVTRHPGSYQVPEGIPSLRIMLPDGKVVL